MSEKKVCLPLFSKKPSAKAYATTNTKYVRHEN